MSIYGYNDRWSVTAGTELSFYVSSDRDCAVEIVRLIHGDDNPRGPGLKFESIEALSPIRANVQAIRGGSYVRLDGAANICSGAFEVELSLMPTRPGRALQGIFASSGPGPSLHLDPEGRLCLAVGEVELLSEPLEMGRWSHVRASFDLSSSEVVLTVTHGQFHPERGQACTLSATADCSNWGGTLFVGAASESAPFLPTFCFNGRIGGFAVHALACDGSVRETALKWHFGLETASRRAVDVSGAQLHGEVINRPMRAIAGARFSGRFTHVDQAPDEFDAIHFHDDDLEDCRWEESFRYRVPDDCPSAIYAARLADGEEVRFLPFVVTPPTAKPNSRIALLLPTLSYLAYSNESLDPEMMPSLCPLRNAQAQADDYAYIAQNSISSLYDRHTDGSGRCLLTTLRPNLTSFNPLHRSRIFDAPHQLGADLHLVDWLEQKGIAFDVITDHELHRDGVSLLAPYSVVLTGSHAEYWSEAMLDGLDAYQQGGGRFVYLSGNGLYWVAELDETGTIGEIRRFGGTESWTAGPGETAISLTGQPGGLWRDRGRAPQRYTGVGMAAQGFDRNAPYKKGPGATDPRAAFIFDGVEFEGGGDLVGDCSALVMTHGAAGYEVDKVDHALGTPAHALLLASSTTLSDSYQYVREELSVTSPYNGGSQNPEVRADMVYYELPKGGAVFSVGSISFCSTLSARNYQSNTSQILENVVRTFADPDWQSGAPTVDFEQPHSSVRYSPA